MRKERKQGEKFDEGTINMRIKKKDTRNHNNRRKTDSNVCSLASLTECEVLD